VVSGLLDEMKEHPTEINRTIEAQEDMSGPPSVLISQAGDLKTRGVPHDSFGPLSLLPVTLDHFGAGEIFRYGELIGTSRELRTQVSTLDPAPLHLRQMADDSDDGKEAIIGCPAELFLGQPVRRCDDLFPLPADITEKDSSLFRA